MKKNLSKLSATFLMFLLLAPSQLMADDTCIFNLSDDVPPNVVLLLDNGAQMEHIITHADYDSTVDNTPSVVTENEGVNGFFNAGGYSIDIAGGKYYIQGIGTDLNLDDSILDLMANGAGRDPIWTINGRTITLPGEPSAAVDASGVKDNAALFRYTQNYLNWIFFGAYPDDGSDLPAYSNFYQAKQAIFSVAKQTANEAQFGIYYFTNTSGGSQAQPLSFVVNTVDVVPANSTLDSAFINNVNNMGTVTYSPLAEGLADIGDYFGSPSSGVVGEYCQQNFVIVVSSGVSSEDQDPDFTWLEAADELADHDYDGDDSGGIGEGNIKIDATVSAVPLNLNGSTLLDDIATGLYENDIVDYQAGFQNVMTYSVGLAGTAATQAFLTNTSNNGNGNNNLYDTTDPEYGKYHFQAASADELAAQLMAAMTSILENTSTFTAPVVPVTRTTSGDKIYLSFFTPLDESNFWEGNVTKFGLSPSAHVTTPNEIVDEDGYLATYPNGAMREEAEPYWQTKDWADTTASNGIANTSRNIYTYFGTDADLTAADNGFSTANASLTDAALGTPASGAANIINYIRGADVYDEDSDSDITENRALITGDALHSEPAVKEFIYQLGGSTLTTAFARVFYGGNDGMVHAVNDADGTEVWGFIPSNQLPRLKEIVEGVGHVYYIDSSMKVFVKDLDGDGYIDDVDGDGVFDAADDDQVIMVFGERDGGDYYHALDITYPDSPKRLWSISSASGSFTNLGNTWAEPIFAKVKTSAADTTGTDVIFVGGGYTSDSSAGKVIYVINVQDGTLVKEFRNSVGVTSGSMDYSIPSNITVVDIDGNGFIDKAYVGDVGGQMWRIGKFADSGGTALTFPATNENINDWEAQVLFQAGCDESSCVDNVDNDSDGIADERRPFFYAPEVALEFGYDLVLTGTGDRTDPCSSDSMDRIFAVRDNHTDTGLTETYFVDASTYNANLDVPTADVDGSGTGDLGFYYPLVAGEKVLAEGLLYYKVFYITTFYPSGAACVAGGDSYIYSIQYKSGQAGTDMDGDGSDDAKTAIGGGIASKPVIIIRENTQKLLVSVGSTSASDDSDSTGAGAIGLDPNAPDHNWFYVWWKGLFD